MLKPEDVPDEAVEAAAIAEWEEERRPEWGAPPFEKLHPEIKKRARDRVRAACLAMLKAWPGMEIEMVFVEENYLILPLPRENTND